MATVNKDADQLKFKIDATFSKKNVIHRSRSRWWDRESVVPEEWRQVKKISQGGHGTIYLQKSKTSHQLRAVKSLQPEYLKEACGLDFKRDLQKLIAVREHSDLFVQFLGWYEDKQGGFVYFAMEYLADGDLGQYLESKGPLADTVARGITKQLLRALEFLHGRDICHRDLKPQNVLIASKSPIRVKLADFGVSKPTKGSAVSLRQGTVAYMAPELLGILKDECTSAVDMWGLGCILYEMFTLETPFMDRRSGKMSTLISTMSGILSPSTPTPAPTDMGLLSDYCKGKIELPTDSLRRSNVTDSALYFIKNLLVVDPRYRMSAKISLRYGWMTDLQTASQNGHVEVVRQLLENGVNTQQYGPAALKVAAKNGHVEVVKLLLKNKVDVNDWYDGSTALQAAARNGRFEVVRLLLMNGAEVNNGLDEPGGRTAMQEAVENGHLEVVKLLLRNGAEISVKHSGLELAAEKGHLEVVKLLLQNGVKVNGQAALQSAAKNGHVEVVRLFMRDRVDADTPQTEYMDFQEAMEYGHPGVSTLHMEDESNKNREITLLSAAKNGHLGVVRLLLENGVDANAWYYGPTTLQAAAGNGHLEIVKLLLENGAEANTQPGEHYDQTALQAAARNGHLEVAKLLLENGAKVNDKPSEHYGQTALQSALENGHIEVGKMLLQHGANANACYYGPTTLQAAAGSGLIEVVQLLLKNGAKVNARPGERYGQTALQAAVENGHFAVMRLLLENGADANAWYHGPTVLQLAARNGNIEAVKLLIENGAKVNAKPGERYGQTALQAALAGEYLGVAKLLLENGANANAWYYGPTMLQAAARNGNLEAVRLLLMNGANIDAKPGGRPGQTVLQAAIEGGHLEIQKLLLENRTKPSNVLNSRP